MTAMSAHADEIIAYLRDLAQTEAACARNDLRKKTNKWRSDLGQPTVELENMLAHAAKLKLSYAALGTAIRKCGLAFDSLVATHVDREQIRSRTNILKGRHRK